MYTQSTTISLLAAGNTVTLSKSYTVLTALTEQKVRIGSATTAYHEYLVGDDGTEGDNQDFLVPAKGGYILIPINVAMTAWINRGITGAPNITVADVWGATWNVGSTTGAGLSSAMDSIDLTDDGLFLWGGDSTDPDATFEDFRDADEGASLTGASRAGMWSSQNGILFVYGNHVVGRTDAGTVTATEFTDSNKTIIFPGGFVDAGWNGFEADLGNASTVDTWTNITVIGRGRTDIKRYFDTELDVTGGATDQIAITAHGFSTGDQVVYSAEGGTEDIGPDATTGESDLVGSGGPGTGANWYVSVVDVDNIQLHPTASDAFAGTSIQGLTASTSNNGENHSLRRGPDTRPDITSVGTAGTATRTDCIIQNARAITLTSATTWTTSQFIAPQSMALASGTLDTCVINGPTTSLGEAFLTATAVSQLGNVDDNQFISGGEGHAIEITTTGGTQGFVGNTFTGYGPGTSNSSGVHDNEFDSTSDVSSVTDEINITSDLFVTGDAVIYSDEGGVASIGLTDGELYYVNRQAAGFYSIYLTEAAAVGDSNRIQLTSTGAETHALYSANAAFHNSTGGTITLQVSGGGTAPSVRNSGGSTTIIENNVSLTLSGMKDNTEVRVYATGTTTELAGVEDATDGTADNRSVTFSLAASTAVDIRFANQNWIVPDRNSIINFSWPTTTTVLPITQVFDRTFDNPA
jgi:hypothetical protein